MLALIVPAAATLFLVGLLAGYWLARAGMAAERKAQPPCRCVNCRRMRAEPCSDFDGD